MYFVLDLLRSFYLIKILVQIYSICTRTARDWIDFIESITHPFKYICFWFICRNFTWSRRFENSTQYLISRSRLPDTSEPVRIKKAVPSCVTLMWNCDFPRIWPLARSSFTWNEHLALLSSISAQSFITIENNFNHKYSRGYAVQFCIN